jgi:hypothetical protein
MPHVNGNNTVSDDTTTSRPGRRARVEDGHVRRLRDKMCHEEEATRQEGTRQEPAGELEVQMGDGRRLASGLDKRRWGASIGRAEAEWRG